MSTVHDLRSEILDSAELLFRRFGYGKTTVAEIAGGCRMSSGNLYRYFASKEEIGAQVAQRCMERHEAAARAVVNRPEPKAARKLDQMIAETALAKHKEVLDDPTMTDLVQTMTEIRWDLVERHMATMCGLFATVLRQGNESGEFTVADVEVTAFTVFQMCVSIFYQPFIVNFSVEDIQFKAKKLSELILKGLERR